MCRLGDLCVYKTVDPLTELSGTADAREGLAALIERRAPVFRGR